MLPYLCLEFLLRVLPSSRKDLSRNLRRMLPLTSSTARRMVRDEASMFVQVSAAVSAVVRAISFVSSFGTCAYRHVRCMHIPYIEMQAVCTLAMMYMYCSAFPSFSSARICASVLAAGEAVASLPSALPNTAAVALAAAAAGVAESTPSVAAAGGDLLLCVFT